LSRNSKSIREPEGGPSLPREAGCPNWEIRRKTRRKESNKRPLNGNPCQEATPLLEHPPLTPSYPGVLASSNPLLCSISILPTGLQTNSTCDDDSAVGRSPSHHRSPLKTNQKAPLYPFALRVQIALPHSNNTCRSCMPTSAKTREIRGHDPAA
jgi:hypothetical protein